MNGGPFDLDAGRAGRPWAGGRDARAPLGAASAIAIAALVAGALLIAGQSTTTVSTAGRASSTTASTAVRPSMTPSAAPTPTSGAIKDCGTDYLASGWPTTIAPSPQQQSCILDAFASGSYAIYTERAQTDGEGGHIEITAYQVIGPRRVRRTVDARGTQPPGGVTVTVCTGLSGDVGPLVASGCAAA